MSKLKDINSKSRVIVLKPSLDYDEIVDMVESRKVKLFQTLLNKPKRSDIHIHSTKLFFEAFLLLSGRYTADFIREVTHTITVDKNVKEIVIDGQTYPILQKKGMLSKLAGDGSTFEEIDEPPNFVGQLRDYQKRGLSWLNFFLRT